MGFPDVQRSRLFRAYPWPGFVDAMKRALFAGSDVPSDIFMNAAKLVQTQRIKWAGKPPPPRAEFLSGEVAALAQGAEWDGTAKTCMTLETNLGVNPTSLRRQ